MRKVSDLFSVVASSVLTLSLFLLMLIFPD